MACHDADHGGCSELRRQELARSLLPEFLSSIGDETVGGYLDLLPTTGNVAHFCGRHANGGEPLLLIKPQAKFMPLQGAKFR